MQFRNSIGLRSTLLLLASLLAVTGCSNERPSGMVKGRITLDGTPVTGADVIIVSNKTRDSFVAPLNKDGEFAVRPPVWCDRYVVYLSSDDPTPEYLEIPEKFRKETLSKVEIDVKEGENEYDLKLDS